MKKTPLILSIVAVVAAVAALAIAIASPAKNKKAASETTVETTAQAGDIVYLRIDTLVVQYDMYNDLRSAFEAKATGVQDDLQKKSRKFDSDVKSFENQINKGLLTRSAAEQQQAALQQRQQDLQNEAAQKQYELQEEEAVMMNQVMDAIKTYLAEYNKDHNFAAILTTSEATNVVIMGSPALDITQEIVEGLNANYIRTRNNQ
ncbi:MAG: OmpH family outer membrane protein [Bacteroidales bacterium]|nr:OmpH family outer membrane protein [Candidatus Cacconaster equi]